MALLRRPFLCQREKITPPPAHDARRYIRRRPDGFIRSVIVTLRRNWANRPPQDLVDNTHNRDHISILILADELGNYPKVRESSLCVCNAHNPMHKIDGATFSRMILLRIELDHGGTSGVRSSYPSVLASWQRVQIKIDADTVPSSPLDGLQEVLP